MLPFSTKPKQPPIDRTRALESIPGLNGGVQLEEQPDGRLLVKIQTPRQSKGWLARFQPATIERKVRLDELGAFVLSQIDGEHTVREIVRAFVKRFSVNQREAELSTAEFLRSLVKRNVISIGVK
ncbi:MAG: PqqD family protein [Lentisphaeria bacterium]|nr:PqqD family protein [Lentisphaeria bacterium]